MLVFRSGMTWGDNSRYGGSIIAVYVNRPQAGISDNAD
jgi:hypothetical protein